MFEPEFKRNASNHSAIIKIKYSHFNYYLFFPESIRSRKKISVEDFTLRKRVIIEMLDTPELTKYRVYVL